MTTFAPAITFVTIHGLRRGFAPVRNRHSWLYSCHRLWQGETLMLMAIGVPSMATVLGFVLQRTVESDRSSQWRLAQYPVE